MQVDPLAKVAADVSLGEGARVFAFANLYGCSVGSETRVASFVEIQKNAHVGERCKISSHSFICEGVTIEDEVFIGHHVCFTNDRFPKACTSEGKLAGDEDWSCETTIVEKGAAIGSGCTILPGIRIGRGAIIGAGSVVTKDVLPFTILAGNPAKIIRQVPNNDLPQ